MTQRKITQAVVKQLAAQPKVVIKKKPVAVSPMPVMVPVAQPLPRRVQQARRRNQPLPTNSRVVTTYNASPTSRRPGVCRTVRVSHREVVKPLTVSTATGKVFEYFHCSVTDRASFPWLSGVANNFDLWKMTSCVYQYVPACSNYASGNIVMAFDYDVTDMNTSQDTTYYTAMPSSVTGAVYNSLSLRIDLSPQRTQMPTKMIAVTDSDHVNQKCAYGNVYFCSGLVQNASNIGTLWVEYNVELIDPYIAGVGGLTGFSGTLVTAPIKGAATPITLSPTTETTPVANTQVFSTVPPLTRNSVTGIKPNSSTDELSNAILETIAGFVMKRIPDTMMAVGTPQAFLTLVPGLVMPASMPNDVIGCLMPADSASVQDIMTTFRFPIQFTLNLVDDGALTAINIEQHSVNVASNFLSYGFEVGAGLISEFPVDIPGNYAMVITGNVNNSTDARAEQMFALVVRFRFSNSLSSVTDVRVHEDVRISANPQNYYFTRTVRGANY